MITLIAESKTTGNLLKEIPTEMYIKARPFFENEANQIMAYIKSMPIEEISQRLEISFPLAKKVYNMAYNFPNKNQGNPAISEFTGEVFKALDYATFNQETKNFSKKHLFIVSSLYGILKTDDIIRPYRLDYKNECAPAGGYLYNFWKTKNSTYLIKLLKETNETEILNLLPNDASKCIDWQIIKASAKIERPNFKLIDANGCLRTPNTSHLKKLRGQFLRHILNNRIDNFQTLYKIATMNFEVDIDQSQPGAPLVLCDN